MRNLFFLPKYDPEANPFVAPPGMSKAKFRLLIWYRYFNVGYGLTSYAKYMIALFGISSLDVKTTIWLGVAYALACQIVGFFWYRLDMIRIDTEIGNRFNDFVGEMRKKIK